MSDKLSINIIIAGRSYPMRIEKNDEERIRKAAKIINENISQYQQRYKGKDNQDFLAMSALQFVIQVLKQNELTDVNPIYEQITDINNELGRYLAKQ